MHPKAYLTSHSRMSDSRWVITPSWLSGSWRSFLYSSSVYSCHLFLTSSASCLWVSRSLWWRCGSTVACCRVGGPECSRVCMGPFEGWGHYLHYLHHSLASGQTRRGGTQPHPSTKTGLKIYWALPCPSEHGPVSPSVSLSHQEASICLLSLSISRQTGWKQQSQKTNQTDHMDHLLV